MAFSPSTPSAAKGHDLASWVILQIALYTAGGQENAHFITQFATLDAVMDTVVASVGS